jgi:uncharacterized protein (UPF0261 family)
MEKHIFILGTLDTKGLEIDYLRGVVSAEGGAPLVVDTGVLGEPSCPPDITREEVAQAANSSIQAIIESRDKAEALMIMARGATRILHQYLQRDQLGGVLSIGGSRGTLLATQAMQTLPIGIPKMMVSTMASGTNPFGPFVGTRDVTMMHSVADILGLNAITKPILTNAATAITAMSRVGRPVESGVKRTFAASMLGATTPLVEQILCQIEKDHYEVVAFHATGTGGCSMEELITDGLFQGVFDVTLAEIMNWLVKSPYAAGPDRLLATLRKGIPLVIAPGGLDFIIEGPPGLLPPKYHRRTTLLHTPAITLVRTTADELSKAARLIAARLSESNGPVAAILPNEGFSLFSTQGQPLFAPELDMVFIETFKEHATNLKHIVELDTHINDPKVAEVAIQLMKDMLN